MKKLIALFSVFVLFGVAALAQDPPKNTVKKPVAAKGKTISKNQIRKAVKANVAPAKMNK